MGLTHCIGADCPLKNSCLRHTQEILGRQDFFGRVPYDEKLARCEHFYDEIPSNEAIEQLAYQLWQAAGRPHDSALSDWLRAKQHLIYRRRRSGG